jgi:Nitrile hydratase, alpha chain
MQHDADPARRELQAELFDRAAQDAGFRRALLADPTGTLERELGARLPAGIGLTVVEETPTRRYLVLPPRPARVEGELSDTELEAVAGGGGGAGILSAQGGVCPEVDLPYPP